MNGQGNPYKIHKNPVKRLIAAAGYSWKGLCAVMRTEPAFRLEVFIACLLIPLALVLDITKAQHIILVFSVVFVLILELINTAIERVIDRISFERHELSKEAKDIGSAIVMLGIVSALFTWVAVLFLWQSVSPA